MHKVSYSEYFDSQYKNAFFQIAFFRKYSQNEMNKG